MEKKNKIKRKFAIITLVMVLLCIIVSVLTLPSFAMPSYNSNLIAPTHSYNLCLGETLTGVSTGKYFVVPDAWAGSPVGSISGAVNTVSSTHTFTNDQYVTMLHEGTTLTYDNVLYTEYSQIYCSTSGSTGSLVFWNSYDDPLTEDVEFMNYTPLLSAENLVVHSDWYDDVFQISYDNSANDTAFACRIVLCGYDVDGVYREKTFVTPVPTTGSGAWTTLQFNLTRLINSAIDTTENINYWFGGYCKIKNFAIWGVTNTSTFKMKKLNYANLWSTYAPFNDADRQTIDKAYMDSLLAYMADEDNPGASFIGSSWVSWLATTVAGVMNVKIFGDAVNFTLGGMVGTIVSLSALAIILKMLR